VLRFYIFIVFPFFLSFFRGKKDNNQERIKMPKATNLIEAYNNFVVMFTKSQKEYKQSIVLRGDLKLTKGKAAAQAAHASLLSYERAAMWVKKGWKKQGQKKVVLKVNSLEELHKLKAEADKRRLPSAIIKDAGLTEIPPGTVTAIGIGPASAEQIDRITKHLKLL
jgi:PTH2 family peptidyl-tRNA hydrolase